MMNEKNNIFVAAFFYTNAIFGHLKIKENINLMVEGLRMELKQRTLIDTQPILPRSSSFFVVLCGVSSLGNSNFAFFQRNFIDESAEKVMMLLTLTTLNKLNSLFRSKNGKYGS